MKKRIHHDSRMSYLIIEPEADIASSLSINMMKNNKIQCLLDMECRYIDNNLALYYEIQGMQSMKEYIEEHDISYNMAKQLYTDIAQAVLNGEEFFLSENFYVMDLEYIFWDKKTKSVKFCCIPEWQGNFQEDIKKLTEVLIESINHNNKNAVTFIYGMYDLITDGGFIISDAKAYIKGFKLDAPDNNLHNNKQGNILESGNRKEYINNQDSSKEYIKENANYNSRKRDNSNNQDNIKADSIELSKYVLCINKSSFPFNAARKEDVNIYLSDIGTRTGENQLETSIGRSSDCNLILPDGYISRHHAVFYMENGKLYIEDLNSSNGTFVNGERIPANVKILCNTKDVISFAGIVCKLSCR